MVRENFRYREVMVTMNFTARVHVAGLLALALAGCYDGLGRQDSMSGTGSVSAASVASANVEARLVSPGRVVLAVVCSSARSIR